MTAAAADEPQAEGTASKDRPPTPPPDPATVAFLDLARWMYAVHDARAESFQRRAAILLAAVGVLFALTANVWFQFGADLSPRERTPIQVLLTLAFALLSAGGVEAVRTLRSRDVALPRIRTLEDRWAAHAGTITKHRQPFTATYVTEWAMQDLAAHGNGHSVLALARDDADNRGDHFRRSTLLVGLGIAAVGVAMVAMLWLS